MQYQGDEKLTKILITKIKNVISRSRSPEQKVNNRLPESRIKNAITKDIKLVNENSIPSPSQDQPN